MQKLKRKKHLALPISVIALIIISAALIAIEPAVPLPGFGSFDESRFYPTKSVVTVIGADNSDLRSEYNDFGEKVSLQNLPRYVPNAFVAIEDKRFYSHKGVDWLRMLGAAKNDLIKRRFCEGASTITQQLVKNTHLCGDKTVKRKIEEIRIARAVERNHDKNEILEAYLNVVYFGGGYYGINDAAVGYFGKKAQRLTLSESAMLAAIINNPSKYNPVTHYDNALGRSKTVLKRMKDQGLIDEEEYVSAINDAPKIVSGNVYAGFFVSGAKAEAKKLLSSRNVKAKNYTIITYCNAKLNEKCAQIADKYSVKDAFTEIIVCDNRSGACIAKAGTIPFVRRMPGSTIKPFISYAPAYEKKLVYPVSPIIDEKVDFGGYCPENADKKYHGAVSVNSSLVYSYNVPAVKLLKNSGVSYAKSVAGRFGLEFDESDNSLALALGAMKKGVTLGSLVESYMTLARGGVRIKPYSVGAIYGENGELLYKHGSVCDRAVGSDTAFLITDALKRCALEGTAKRLKNRTSGDVAAKTGTVGSKKGNTDAYCIAYTPVYTVAVRVSASGEKLLPNEICGSTVPSSVAAEILSYLDDRSRFTVPDSVVEMEISRVGLENDGKVIPVCGGEKRKNVITAWFSKNNLPFVFEAWYEGKLDNFDDFEICDALVNQSVDVA